MPSVPRLPLRIAVVQFAPKIGHVQANVNKARELCRKIQPRSLDLICLPEMCFTGYAFPSAAAISPYLEVPRTGPTSIFCSDLAQHLECYVIAGYPERLSPEEPREDHQVGANSAVIYDRQGVWVGGYRKTNLFQTDMTWAKPGTGFTTFNLPSPLRTVSLGICMDLNAQPPADWTIEEGPYELADYARERNSNVLILLDAWLDSDADGEEGEPDWSNLNYWAMRLRPLYSSEDSKGTEDGHETIVVVCNRTGEENGRVFAGSSAVYSMQLGSRKPKLLDVMGRKEEGVRVWDLLV